MTQQIARMALVGAMAFLFFHLGDDVGKLAERSSRDRDELAWISASFGVAEAQLSEVRQLHRSFLVEHRRTVQRIEGDSAELARELDVAGSLTPELTAKLERLERQRSRSHAEVLEHCLRVRAVLKGEAGERYLHEMERVLLGLQARHHVAGGRHSQGKETAND